MRRDAPYKICDRTHRLCRVPQEWQFSSLHRLMAMGVYEANWGMDERVVEVPSWGSE